jgi:hypothetical protein
MAIEDIYPMQSNELDDAIIAVREGLSTQQLADLRGISTAKAARLINQAKSILLELDELPTPTLGSTIELPASTPRNLPVPYRAPGTLVPTGPINLGGTAGGGIPRMTPTYPFQDLNIPAPRAAAGAAADIGSGRYMLGLEDVISSLPAASETAAAVPAGRGGVLGALGEELRTQVGPKPVSRAGKILKPKTLKGKAALTAGAIGLIATFGEKDPVTNAIDPVATAKKFGEFGINLVANELLGVDDFTRAYKAAREGNWFKAAKSLGVGAFELGSTLIPAGAILKGAKAGTQLAKTGSLAARGLARVPGLANEAGMLTKGGTAALKGFRGAEIGQNAYFGNVAAAQAGLPAFSVGEAKPILQERAGMQPGGATGSQPTGNTQQRVAEYLQMQQYAPTTSADYLAKLYGLTS